MARIEAAHYSSFFLMCVLFKLRFHYNVDGTMPRRTEIEDIPFDGVNLLAKCANEMDYLLMQNENQLIDGNNY